MEAHPVDPRDTEVEIERPTYRVYFTRALDDAGATEADEWEVRDAESVHDVLTWAHEKAGSEWGFTIYIVFEGALLRIGSRRAPP